MSEFNFRVSLVIATRNRAAFLPMFLDALNRMQSTTPFEIILVDNGSTDSTQSVLAEFAQRSVHPIKVLSELKRGVSAARNAGSAVAKGEILAFTDDDCYPTPDFVDCIASCFDEHDIGFLGGRMLRYDPKDLPITFQTSEVVRTFVPDSYINPGVIHGGNCAVRRAVFLAVGGFDTLLGAGTACMGAEDVDILQRVSAAGYTGRYDPRPAVYHHHRRQAPSDGDAILRSYAISRGAYFVKGLLNRRLRRHFLWPVMRRLGGNLLHLRWSDMRQELRGAWIYLRARRQGAHLP